MVSRRATILLVLLAACSKEAAAPAGAPASAAASAGEERRAAAASTPSPPPPAPPAGGRRLADRFKCGDEQCRKGQYCHSVSVGADLPPSTNCVDLEPECAAAVTEECLQRVRGCGRLTYHDGALHLYCTAPAGRPQRE
jgi:hypothetical protein